MGDLSLELGALRAAKDAAVIDASATSARAAALESELRSSAKALAEAHEGFDSEVCKVGRLTRDVAELQVRAEKDAKAAAEVLASEGAARSALEKEVRGLIGEGLEILIELHTRTGYSFCVHAIIQRTCDVRRTCDYSTDM